jgi:hypothetical protein
MDDVKRFAAGTIRMVRPSVTLWIVPRAKAALAVETELDSERHGISLMGNIDTVFAPGKAAHVRMGMRLLVGASWLALRTAHPVSVHPALWLDLREPVLHRGNAA